MQQPHTPPHTRASRTLRAGCCCRNTNACTTVARCVLHTQTQSAEKCWLTWHTPCGSTEQFDSTAHCATVNKQGSSSVYLSNSSTARGRNRIQIWPSSRRTAGQQVPADMRLHKLQVKQQRATTCQPECVTQAKQLQRLPGPRTSQD